MFNNLETLLALERSEPAVTLKLSKQIFLYRLNCLALPPSPCPGLWGLFRRKASVIVSLRGGFNEPHC